MIPGTSLSPGGAPPAVRRPEVRIGIGGGALALGGPGVGAPRWDRALVSVTIRTTLAPAVDEVRMTFAAPSLPMPHPGDPVTIALGYADQELPQLFTGFVDRVRRALDGTLRITALNGASALARVRLGQSFEKQTAGEIVRELARVAELSVGTIEPGNQLPFFALDDRRSGWSIIAELALRNGFLARFAPEGSLEFGPAGTRSVRTFRYGEEILSFELSHALPTVGTIRAHGEGAAGTEGEATWGWLAKDPAPITAIVGSGSPERVLEDRSLRSAAAVRDAAAGLLGAAQAGSWAGSLLVAGAPEVELGSPIEIAGMPDSGLNRKLLVTALRHDLDTNLGFRTRISLCATADETPVPAITRFGR